MSSTVLPSKPIDSRKEFSGILREQSTFAAPGGSGVGHEINGRFDQLFLQTGWGIPPAVVLMLCVISAVLLGGAAFVWSEHLLPTAMGAFVGMILPIGVATLARGSRQKTINEQLPGMIEELARAARTGRSLEACLAMVAKDTKAPLGSEMQYCVDKLNLGMTIPTAFAQLPERTGVVGTSIFTTALAVHRQTGGDLVHVLDRLARTLRDRSQFLGRLRASTTASRLTALLMIALPPCIIAFFLFRDPAYFQNLMDSSWGRATTITAFVLMVVGSIWVLRVLTSSRKV
ncbi:MAG: type II secretion system F family protein [Planctomycetaceae bacterium]